jgi:hypothetical protein
MTAVAIALGATHAASAPLFFSPNQLQEEAFTVSDLEEIASSLHQSNRTSWINPHRFIVYVR